MRRIRRWAFLIAAACALGACRDGDVPDREAMRTPPAPSTAMRSPRAPREVTDRQPARVTTPALPSTLDQVVAPADTFDRLRQRYGEAEVVRAILPAGEGTEVPGWVVFPHDPARRVAIYLDDAGGHPASAVVRERSAWTRADGLRVGLDATALEALNGGPFAFSGFDWDYGGYVTDWKGGRLDRGGRTIGPVRLCAPPDVPDDYPSGEGDFMSDLPSVRGSPPVICELGIAFGAARMP